MLRVNLADDLVNGATGTIVDFVPAATEKLSSLFRVPRFSHVGGVMRVYHDHMTQQGVALPMMPMVKFKTRDAPVSIPPHAFATGGTAATQYFEALSVALPLQPAYAFTIHKVQGLTLLGDVRLELETMWPCPHAMYVAMSRVKRASQLTVSGFRRDLIRVNAQAVLYDSVVKPVQQVDPSETAVSAAWASHYEVTVLPAAVDKSDFM
jgi:hypothetical protein